MLLVSLRMSEEPHSISTRNRVCSTYTMTMESISSQRAVKHLSIERGCHVGLDAAAVQNKSCLLGTHWLVRREKMIDRTGERVGNYRLMKLLGSGGFAHVYLGQHVYLDSSAAIKLMYMNLAQEDWENFRAEART